MTASGAVAARLRTAISRARRGNTDSIVKQRRRGRRSAGRRSTLSSVPCGTARALRQRARLPALHRGVLWPRDRASGDSDGRLAGPIAGLSPRSSCPVQPIEGQPPIVGADGDPRPPECPADEAGPAGAAPRSANKRHRLTPSNEQGDDEVLNPRYSVKENRTPHFRIGLWPPPRRSAAHARMERSGWRERCDDRARISPAPSGLA